MGDLGWLLYFFGAKNFNNYDLQFMIIIGIWISLAMLCSSLQVLRVLQIGENAAQIRSLIVVAGALRKIMPLIPEDSTANLWWIHHL